ncbi:helix-turn-helix domain-containing protein [Collinsella tanakaei]|mgnify:CR=1 FL=1|uniref:Helix-turn-helix domain-containing protein n=1 Tax=Collinsella tanakaei TaxID=626935 RepID=A0A3E4QVH8_9ACTN|nr:XRE family transcriptional regulator [Collinsella tanakaei]RGL11087.1 helix-turn-helix domain-containing protein [Collinsella tanakaei]
MGIPENIDALLVKFDITQEALARIAGVAPSSVNGWRNGAVPRKNAIERMCQALEITRDDIMSDEFGLAAKEHGRVPSGAKLPTEPRPAYAPLLGRVHAGDACEPDVIDDRIPIPYEVRVAHPHGYFLEVEGDCMSRVYPEGCHIYIDPAQQPRNGSVAVVSIDGADYVMRRLYNTGRTIVLSPDSWSDRYEDIVITAEDERTVEYVGTVVWFQPAEEME